MALTKVTGEGVGTLDSATITSATISNQLVTANMPSGTILQFKKSVLQNQSQVGITATGYNSSILYGANRNGRTYGNATNVVITPTSNSSILYCIGLVGWSDMVNTATMAHGVIITRNDGTDSIDNSDYPWYNQGNMSISYYPSEQIIGTFSPASTSSQTIRLRPYTYIEGSATATSRYVNASLFVMEIAQ